MSKIALNKSALSLEKKRQGSFQKYLPSLELKQKQLLAERKRHEQMLSDHQQQCSRIEQDVNERLPMLAVAAIDLEGLVQVSDLDISFENLLGTKLPQLNNIAFETQEYSYLVRPHWVDEAAIALKKVLQLKIEEKVITERLVLLEAAVQIITQRVNLFSKVLLPQTHQNIKQISQFLADQERSAVMRSKLAKDRHRQAANSNGESE